MAPGSSPGGLSLPRPSHTSKRSSNTGNGQLQDPQGYQSAVDVVVSEAMLGNSEELAREHGPPEREVDGRLKPGGPSLNPSGRPPDQYTLTGALKALLRQPADPEKPDGPSRAEELAEQMLADAMAGDVKAQIAVGERTDGKPIQPVALAVDGTNPHDFQLPVRTSRRRRSAAGDQAQRDEQSIEAEVQRITTDEQGQPEPTE